MKRFAVISISIACLIVAAMFTPQANAMVYHVEIKDLDPGQPITPPVVAIHKAGYQMFEVGAQASAGLEALAEDGLTDMLVNEAQSHADVMNVKVGGSGPTFGSFKFLVEGEPGDYISIASMFARTNDNFIGTSAQPLPPAGQPMEIDSQVYDAGTEMNTGLIAHIPAYDNVMVGPEENGTISVINDYVIMDDPNDGQVEFEWPPAAKIIITPMPNAINYDIHMVSQSEGQPISPSLVAVHDDRAQIFEPGTQASAGLEELAESGSSSTLINELTPLTGVWIAQRAGDGPGGEQRITITAEPGQLITMISMFGRTNDVFTGITNQELPSLGSMLTLDGLAYDAGTETNTGLMAHIPFYGNSGGPTEGGMISEINVYTIVDDPEGELVFNWPPATQVTIEPRDPQSDVQNWALY